jgi:hypothetical protein
LFRRLAKAILTIERGGLIRGYPRWGVLDFFQYPLASVVSSGPPTAGLVRYVMMNGREWDRVQLPILVTLEPCGDYKVRVSVQDDRFIAYLNGQVISSWSDKRLHRGGVGFFSDEDDPQKVDWVSLSERDSFLGRVLAHFSLIVMPSVPLP